MMRRLLFNIGIFLSIIFFPAWVTLAVFLAALFLVRASLFEVVLWGGLLDVISAVYVHGFPYVPVFYTLVAALMFLAMEFLKPHLVFYESGR